MRAILKLLLPQTNTPKMTFFQRLLPLRSSTFPLSPPHLRRFCWRRRFCVRQIRRKSTGDRLAHGIWGYALSTRWSRSSNGRPDGLYRGSRNRRGLVLPPAMVPLDRQRQGCRGIAITKLPPDCREMTVRMTSCDGDISIAFRLGETITGMAEFGVCYHFLRRRSRHRRRDHTRSRFCCHARG